MSEKYTELSKDGLIEVFSNYYYQGFEELWEVKEGDYYVIGRSARPFHLCKIIRIEDDEVNTIMCEQPEAISTWKLSEFRKGFGVHRLPVPDWMFNYEHYFIDERDARIAELERRLRDCRLLFALFNQFVRGNSDIEDRYTEFVINSNKETIKMLSVEKQQEIYELKIRTLDGADKRIKKLQSELDKRDRALEVARKGLDFYASEKNWKRDNKHSFGRIIENDFEKPLYGVIEDITGYTHDKISKVGGGVSRRTLREIDNILKGEEG